MPFANEYCARHEPVGAKHSDGSLLVHLRGRGESAATEALWGQHHGPTLRYARGLAGPTLAEDLTSEAFVRTLTALRRGAGPTTSIRPYLLRTVHNLYVSHVRRRPAIAWDPFVETTSAEPQEARTPDLALRVTDTDALRRVFSRLPDRARLAMWLLYVEGIPLDEVAADLHITPNALSQLTFRARRSARDGVVAASA